MVVDCQSACSAVKIVLKNKEGKNTVLSSVMCGAFTGICTGIGALLGPVGMVAGAMCGSTVAYIKTRDTFKSILDVINEDMSDSEREELMLNVLQFIRELEVADAITLLSLARGNINFQDQLFTILKTAVRNWQRNRSIRF